MIKCRYLTISEDECYNPHFRCSINDENHINEFMSMKSYFENRFAGKYFIPNGKCIFRYNTEDLTICPCYNNNDI